MSLCKIEWKTINGDVYTWPKMSKTEKKATAGDHEAGLHTLLQEQFLQVTEQQKCKATIWHQPRRFFFLPQ